MLDKTIWNTFESSCDSFLNVTVIFVCTMSLILCVRGLLRAAKLYNQTNLLFTSRLKLELSYSEAIQFVNMWYLLIVINDLLLITGSVITEMLEINKTTVDLWDVCSVLLGTGNLLVWIGMLRYLGFFPTYNALILTVKGAFPNVARFVICSGLVYLGFTFCGWIPLNRSHVSFPCRWYGIFVDLSIPISFKYFLILFDINSDPRSLWMVFGAPKEVNESWKTFISVLLTCSTNC